MQKRRAFIEDDTVKFKRHAKYEPNPTDSNGYNKYKKMQSSLQGKINLLQKELSSSSENKSDQEPKEKSNHSKDSLINIVKSMDIPGQQQKKIIAYMEKYFKALRTVNFNKSLIERAH